MIYLLIVYLVIGLAVYALSDTRGLASKLADRLVVVSYGLIQKYFFLLIVVLWPLWLLLRLRARE